MRSDGIQTNLFAKKDIDFENLTRTEKFTVYDKRNIPFEGEISATILSFDDLFFSPLSQLKCIQCGFYGRTFFCGQKVPPYYSWQKKLKKYNFFLLIKGKINVEPRIKDNSVFTSSSWKAGFYAGNEGTNILKKRVMQRRVETMSYLAGYGKLKTFAEGGGCKLCRKCASLTNEKCKHPDMASPSPEGMGIDLYTMIPEMEIPPINNFWSVSMVYGNLKQKGFKYQKISLRNRKTEPLTNLENVIEYYRVSDIWDPDFAKTRCNSCTAFSSFLCDRKRYDENDLYELIKDRYLYAIKLKKEINTVKGLDELHKYQLWVHRQGYWDSFAMAPLRCPICKVCNLDVHMQEGYKKISNRSIPFCVSYFNLKPLKSGKNIGYLLV